MKSAVKGQKAKPHIAFGIEESGGMSHCLCGCIYLMDVRFQNQGCCISGDGYSIWQAF